MDRAAGLSTEIDALRKISNANAVLQDEIEANFAIAMGDMLKEGYWNDSKYAVGQEEYLYADALDMMEAMSKPDVDYSVSLVSLANQFKYKPGDLKINMQARIYDAD